MAENPATEAGGLPSSGVAHWRPVRLETLVRLRWLALAGQLASVLAVAGLLRYPLPFLPCLGLIGLSALINTGLQLRFGSGHRVTDRVALAQLAFDCIQLGGLLWLTGGLTNPFSILLLAPVSVSATTLDQKTTAILSALAIGIASLLTISHMPLPWEPGAPILFPSLYIAGIWLSLLLGVIFISAYTNRVAHEARQLTNALSATELALSRQQQLRALDGLAAAAAHELGTPLSTIALAAREMRSEAEESALTEDIDLILDQVVRCRAILGKLRNLEREADEPFADLPLGELIAEAAQPYQHQGKTILYEARTISGPEPVIGRSVGLIYGLGNLIENAVQFAASRVSITADWNDKTVVVAIADDGPGFPQELVARIGEPYVTSRPRLAATDPERPGGLGLGIFIAKTLLERSGAELIFFNRVPNGAAVVEIRWPRHAISADSAARPDFDLRPPQG